MVSEVSYLDGEVSYEDIWHHDITSEGFRGSKRSVHVVESDGYHYYLAQVEHQWYLYSPRAGGLYHVHSGLKRTAVVNKANIIEVVKDMFNAI